MGQKPSFFYLDLDLVGRMMNFPEHEIIITGIEQQGGAKSHLAKVYVDGPVLPPGELSLTYGVKDGRQFLLDIKPAPPLKPGPLSI